MFSNVHRVPQICAYMNQLWYKCTFSEQNNQIIGPIKQTETTSFTFSLLNHLSQLIIHIFLWLWGPLWQSSWNVENLQRKIMNLGSLQFVVLYLSYFLRPALADRDEYLKLWWTLDKYFPAFGFSIKLIPLTSFLSDKPAETAIFLVILGRTCLSITAMMMLIMKPQITLLWQNVFGLWSAIIFNNVGDSVHGDVGVGGRYLKYNDMMFLTSTSREGCWLCSK